PFSLHAATSPRQLPSFPTRRSSDLPDELEADPVECGSSTARVLSGVPGRARMYRAVQLLTASATDRLWITDAYLIAPPPLYASLDRKSTRLNSSHVAISYAVFCLKK